MYCVPSMYSKISVIIPCKNISQFLTRENLPALDKQVYKNFEVIIIIDHNEQYNTQILKKYPWLDVLSSKKVTRPAEKRDYGFKKARGDIIAFIDDDAYPHPTWLYRAVQLFKDQKISAVCGPGILPPHGKLWEKVGDAVLHTWLGAGEYQYRFAQKKSRFVDDYPSMNFFIRTQIFKRLGGFNNEYWPGEDSKLCNDLVYKMKGKILYHPSVLVYHHRRNNLTAYLAQHANYGYHRGAFFAQGDTNSRKISYCIPTFFILYLGFLFIYSIFLRRIFFFPVFFLPFFIYLVALFYACIKTFLRTKDFTVSLFTPFVLFFTHTAYGILFIKGFYKKNHIYD